MIRSGIITIDVPYNMSFSDLGDFCCELDHMVLDYVAGLHTELDEIMDSARCYSPKVDMDSVVLPKKMKDLVLQRAENFDIFRKLRKEVRDCNPNLGSFQKQNEIRFCVELLLTLCELNPFLVVEQNDRLVLTTLFVMEKA